MIVPDSTLPKNFRPNPVVSIEEYSRYIETSECEILGVTNAPNANNYECRDIWTLIQRQYIQNYLSEAQEEIEQYLGYFLTPDWVVGDISNERDSLFRYVDQQNPRFRPRSSKHLGTYKTRWKHITAIGTRAETDIELNSTVNHATDPAVVTVATAITDVNEIKVYHPGSDIEINPSEITFSGGTATISIPRCRMVLESLLDNSTSGVDYTDTNNFESEVDVKRVYTDSTTQATLLCSNCSECTFTNVTGCLRVLSEKAGTIEFITDNVSCTCGCSPKRIGFNYYCGDINVTQKAKEMVIRLAHSKMPNEPCGCEIAQRLWRDDREVPDVVTQDLMNNPFGINRGAILTWMWLKGTPRELSFGSM